jgi:hypothetical protein
MKVALILTAVFVTNLIIATSHAEIFRYTDENGKVIYSDRAHNKRAEAVNLPPINTQPGIKLPVTATTDETSEEEAERLEYKSIGISYPNDETTITYGQESIGASAKLKPELQAGDTIQFYLNGTPYGKASTSSSTTIDSLTRGEQTISAAVLNEAGKVLLKSNSIRIYVMRKSVPN